MDILSKKSRTEKIVFKYKWTLVKKSIVLVFALDDVCAYRLRASVAARERERERDAKLYNS